MPKSNIVASPEIQRARDLIAFDRAVPASVNLFRATPTQATFDAALAPMIKWADLNGVVLVVKAPEAVKPADSSAPQGAQQKKSGR